MAILTSVVYYAYMSISHVYTDKEIILGKGDVVDVCTLASAYAEYYFIKHQPAFPFYAQWIYFPPCSSHVHASCIKAHILLIWHTWDSEISNICGLTSIWKLILYTCVAFCCYFSKHTLMFSTFKTSRNHPPARALHHTNAAVDIFSVWLLSVPIIRFDVYCTFVCVCESYAYISKATRVP